MRVDAIVNTTNEEMIGYSGIDLAIHTKAGAGLDAECREVAPLSLGQAKITCGYDLPALNTDYEIDTTDYGVQKAM